jgi:hypothetical protein
MKSNKNAVQIVDEIEQKTHAEEIKIVSGKKTEWTTMTQDHDKVVFRETLFVWMNAKFF